MTPTSTTMTASNGRNPRCCSLRIRKVTTSAKLGIATGQNLAEVCRDRFPRPVVYAMWVLSELVACWGEQGWDRADAVISGIPYTLLPRTTTEGIVRASWRALAPGGLFVAYQYSPYLRPFLRSVFGNCRLGLVLRNLPPAVVFVSRKEPTAGSSRVTRRAR